MPCDDVTELLELKIDEEDRLASYRLFKRSCGRAVGEQSLLLDTFEGQTAGDMLSLDADGFVDRHGLEDETELFLQLKHFFALQSGLRVLLGMEPGGLRSSLTVANVAHDQGVYTLQAEISVDVLTERIESCGKCKGCGSIAKKLKEVS